ncbi:MAG: MFS transporter [Actinomycetota bacterium]
MFQNPARYGTFCSVTNNLSQNSASPSDSTEATNPTLTILAMCLSVVVVIAGVAGLTVAIPTIGAELQATQSELQWIIDSYAIVLAALLLPAGALGDRFGRKRMMLAGWAVFVAATAATALTEEISLLITFRAISGAGAALVFPGTLSTITNVIPDERRTQAIAAWTVSASLGGTIGSVGAGALIEGFWFGSIFVATAIIGALIAVLTAVAVPETSDPQDSNLDPIGSIASLIGIGAITLGIIEGPIKGWSDPLVVGGLVIGVVGLVAFVVWELRTDRPLLDVRLFRLRGFSTGSLSIFLQFLAAFGFFFTASQFLAFVFDYSPLMIGLGLLPIGVTIPLGSAIAPKAIERFGRGPTGAAGLLALAVGLGWFNLVGVDTDYWFFAIGVLIFGLGFGLAAPPATEAIVEALPRHRQGVASAMNDVTRELGGAFGIAIIGSALTSGYRSTIESELPPELAEPIGDSAGAGLAIAAQSGADGAAIVEAVQQGVADGFGVAMTLAAVAAVVGAVYVALRTPRTGAEQSAL